MTALKLPRHPGLFSTTRLRRMTSQELTATLTDWLILLSAGVLAACSSVFLDLGIKGVPGHAILRVVFPMALGLALVPRRGAGCAMGTTAFMTGVLLHLTGFKGEGLGVGALASLTVTGPFLDVALRRANGGWRQYVAFAIAGLSSNTVAFVIRGVAKATGFEAPGRRPLAGWLWQASFTYVICGLLAGLISGVILFYARGRSEDSAEIQP
ncbi:MAG: hypothetical protein JSS49_10585 [Planctomycetes bacterium]|nr:hypothetical protein [Planctomycetota bacterium]